MEQETLKSIIRKGLIQEYKELLVPEYTLGWKMERWCREHEINSMSFDNTIAAILAEVDKAGLTDEQLYHLEQDYGWGKDTEERGFILSIMDITSQVQLQTIKDILK